MPDQEPVVWPDDPVEGDSPAEAAEPAKPLDESSWPASFEEALQQSRAQQEPATPPPGAVAPINEYPTQHSLPAIPAKTQPPAPAEPLKTVPPEPAEAEEPVIALGTPDEMPTSTFKTPIPAPAGISASNGGEATINEAAAAEPESQPEPEAEPEVVAEMADTRPEAAGEPMAADEPEETPEPEADHEPEPIKLEEVEPSAEPADEAEPEPEPVTAPEAEPQPEPVTEPEPAPEPVKAAEPEPAPKEEEWIPLPANPPVPSWAPQLGAAAQAAEQKVDWPGSNLPAWAPVGGGRSTSNMPAATRISSTPAPGASQPPAPASRPAPASGSAPAPASSQPPAPAAAASQPGAAEPAKGKSSSWEIVPPKVSDQQKTAYAGPSAEDKSYAEWFAWAKRSGAPAAACHAAAQGAFRALAGGHDMNTAVQWATVAMGSPPGLVSASRQLYCAWYSLGNIDLRLPSPQAHAFAAGSIAALEAGADAPSAHQAGLAAAGITG